MAQRHCKNDPPTQADNYICIYYIVNSPLDSGGQRATNHADSTRKHRTGRALRSKSLLGRAPQPPAARNRCSGVPRSLLAFEITARARFFVFGNTRKRRPSVSARSRGSSKRRWIRQRFRVSCGIPFEIPFGIALLRTLHCFELCFARLHRHRQVPYANLVYIYIYTCSNRYINLYVYFSSFYAEVYIRQSLLVRGHQAAKHHV